MSEAAEIRTKNRTAFPVFRGLNELRVSDAELAEALDAPVSDVAAWRAGVVRMPGRVAAFLTLILDAMVDRQGGDAIFLGAKSAVPFEKLMRARDSLQQQQAFNLGLAREDLVDGLRLFDDWLTRKVAVQPAADLAERLFLRGREHMGAAAC